MNYINNYKDLGYKECAYQDCNKKGIKKLRVLFINIVSYFCDSCIIQLLELGIVTKERIK